MALGVSVGTRVHVAVAVSVPVGVAVPVAVAVMVPLLMCTEGPQAWYSCPVSTLN